ncbi:MAG: ABC transporter ATP-binding protein [Proteobacteria bacterium]|nr:ABC transporter ATP-binding protein [Pseudomonadota bacterium]
MDAVPLLRTENLSRHFGGVKALSELTFTVRKGLIQAVIGPNGAGKTTLFNVISGVFPQTSGKVFFQEQEITGLPTHAIARRGLTRTFQNLRLFSEMTVLENIMVGMHLQSRGGFLASAFRLPWVLREEKRIREESLGWLDFVEMTQYANIPAASLPFGKQRILELARGLALKPSLLMLDEPAAGLNIRETEELAALILRIRDNGITVLLVEHDMDLVMGISDHVTVVDQGKKLADGDPETIRNDERVLKAYLGEE